MNLSILVPVYNEEDCIQDFIKNLINSIKILDVDYEIIFINDGSEDNSLKLINEAASEYNSIKIINHPYNIGYGAALKTGLRSAKFDWICIIDADMTYPTDKIKDLFYERKDYDMVVASRTGSKVEIPLIRRPFKWFITKLACYLTDFNIPDLNSGLRVFKKNIAMQFFKLFPSGFSFTTTITLACLTNDYRVKYIPIDYHKRVGKSSIKPHHFLNFVILIFRIVIYFKPLKFFVFPALLLICGGVGLGIHEIIYNTNISDSSILLILSGFQFLSLGIIADLIVKSRYSEH